VRRCLSLAAEKPRGILNALNQSIDAFLCRALRGEPAPWPVAGGSKPGEFLDRCRHHGIAALLYHRMKGRDTWQDWPLELREALEQSRRAAVAQELLGGHYLKQLMRHFAEREIDCILTKGEALAVSLYPDPGTRTRSDSDLLIRISDISRARQAVVELGYEIVSPVYKTHQFTVMRPGDRSGNIRFDIHWRILNAPRFARVLLFEEAWRNSIEVPRMAPARMLCNIDALLLACMHRFGSERHDRNRLIWLHDIQALTAAMAQAELLQFAAKAVDWHIQDVCLDALLKSGGCFAFSAPARVMDLLKTPGPPKSQSRRLAESQLGLLLDDWQELANGRTRIELLKELFLPPGQQLLRKYGKSNKFWLPLLYVRQILGGLYDRLSFR